MASCLNCGKFSGAKPVARCSHCPKGGKRGEVKMGTGDLKTPGGSSLKSFGMEAEYTFDKMHAALSDRLQESSSAPSSNVDHGLRDNILDAGGPQQQVDAASGALAEGEHMRKLEELVRKSNESAQKKREAELSERFAAVTAANTNPDNLGVELVTAQRQYDDEKAQERARNLIDEFADKPNPRNWRYEPGGPDVVFPSDYKE